MNLQLNLVLQLDLQIALVLDRFFSIFCLDIGSLLVLILTFVYLHLHINRIYSKNDSNEVTPTMNLLDVFGCDHQRKEVVLVCRAPFERSMFDNFQ